MMKTVNKVVFRKDGFVTVNETVVGKFHNHHTDTGSAKRKHAKGFSFTALDGSQVFHKLRISIEADAIDSYKRIKAADPLGKDVLIDV